MAPEVNYGMISYQNDIYSLGRMYYYLMDGIEIQDNTIIKLIEESINNDPKIRPSIYDLFIAFYNIYHPSSDIFFI